MNKYFHELSNQVIKRSTIRTDLRGTTHRNTSSKSFMKLDIDSDKVKYDEELENRIEEKYLKEVGDKFKYKINEMNEKIVILNHETKKVIIDTAVENTIYNIISDAANGYIDLTEKQRIYFFLDKNMKSIDSNVNNNQNDISKTKEEKQEKEEIKNEENKENKEEEKNEKNNFLR